MNACFDLVSTKCSFYVLNITGWTKSVQAIAPVPNTALPWTARIFPAACSYQELKFLA